MTGDQDSRAQTVKILNDCSSDDDDDNDASNTVTATNVRGAWDIKPLRVSDKAARACLTSVPPRLMYIQWNLIELV